MALLGHLARQTCRNVNIRSAACSRRVFHASASAGKKKESLVIEDLFANFEDNAETSTPAESSAGAKPALISEPGTSTSQPARVSRGKHRGLAPDVRLARFNDLYEFVVPRIGKNPAVKVPQVKKSAWVHMVNLATTEEQLTKVVNMFPKWREMGWEFDETYAEVVTSRCQELGCPLLALKIFGDYSTYGLPLSLRAGRQMLFSLHDTQPIDKVIATAALYSVYRLPPIVEDLPSCAFLVIACLKEDSKYSNQVANALLPHLQKMIEASPRKRVDKSLPELAQDRGPLWVERCLVKLDKLLNEKRGEKFAKWLRQWRQESGMVKPST
ncbi:hypothetical protein HGRIS_006288 [Hohenbuehelia grisea]|uniref:Uncharacterized protein n=1 Tax=Hohenbuehelia grisea TaxID=104357 RepID=A0ABR3K2A9_9AGAR